MLNDFEISELLAAKLCHDLAGPIGAIHNGLEFFQEENPAMKERAHNLIEASAQQAVIRLQFFRQLYGISPARGEANLSELRTLAENFFINHNVSITWPLENLDNMNFTINHRFAKIILNLLYIAAIMLIYGGKVSVQLEKSSEGQSATIIGEGKGLKPDPHMIQILNNELEDIAITTKNIHIYLLNKLIQSVNSRIAIEINEKLISFKIDHVQSK